MTRFEDFIFGCLLGFAFGYMVRKLTEIKETVDESDRIVKRIRDDKGRVSRRVTGNLALAVVVVLSFFAAIQSQQASNDSDKITANIAHLQIEQTQNLNCTTQVLFNVAQALNERTQYTTAQADANIELLKGQLKFLKLITGPPLSSVKTKATFNAYVHKVTHYLDIAQKAKSKAVTNPYPTVDDLADCLAQSPEDTKEPVK